MRILPKEAMEHPFFARVKVDIAGDTAKKKRKQSKFSNSFSICFIFIRTLIAGVSRNIFLPDGRQSFTLSHRRSLDLPRRTLFIPTLLAWAAPLRDPEMHAIIVLRFRPVIQVESTELLAEFFPAICVLRRRYTCESRIAFSSSCRGEFRKLKFAKIWVRVNFARHVSTMSLSILTFLGEKSRCENWITIPYSFMNIDENWWDVGRQFLCKISTFA